MRVGWKSLAILQSFYRDKNIYTYKVRVRVKSRVLLAGVNQSAVCFSNQMKQYYKKKYFKVGLYLQSFVCE